MRIIITGAGGQVGTILQQTFADHDLVLFDLPDFDMTKPSAVQEIEAINPDLILHTAAMTNVDACAQNPSLAYMVNGFGTQNIALGAMKTNAAMVHISTNEVFDGTATTPYHEYALTNPINPYAESKRAAEEIARQLVQKLYIVRIAWAFAPGGNNFPSKIIKAANKFGKLKVVTDEVSSPTYAPDLAEALSKLVQTEHYGIYHLTNEGICSRYDFAVEILRQAHKEHIPVEPITSEGYDRPSTPPKYAPIKNNLAATLGIQLRPWQEALEEYFRA